MSGKQEVGTGDAERTKKREPGKIQRALKVSLVGDGTVSLNFPMTSFRSEKHAF